MNNITKEEVNIVCEDLVDFRVIRGSYCINDDLTVDVTGEVTFNYTNHTHIPVQFGSVSGDFDCYSTQLTSTKGFPTFIGGAFRFASTGLIHSDENFLRIRHIFGLPDLIRNGDFFELRVACVHMDQALERAYYLWIRKYERIETINELLL